MASNVAYATLAQVKTRMALSTTGQDDIINALLPAVSRAIDTYCRRRFYLVTETRRFDFKSSTRLWFDEDLYSLTTLTLGDSSTLTESTHFYLYPLDGPPYRWLDIRSDVGSLLEYGNSPQRALSVLGSWGYSATPPPEVVQACVSWTAAVVQASSSGSTGVASMSIGEYSVSYQDPATLLAGPPPDAKFLLGGLVYRPVVSVGF